MPDTTLCFREVGMRFAQEGPGAENLDILEVLGSSDEVLPLVAARMAAAAGVPLAAPSVRAAVQSAVSSAAPATGLSPTVLRWWRSSLQALVRLLLRLPVAVSCARLEHCLGRLRGHAADTPLLGSGNLRSRPGNL